MPATKAVLRDIHDNKLKPNKEYTTVSADGRLKNKVEPVEVAVEVKASPEVLPELAPFVDVPPVEEKASSDEEKELQNGLKTLESVDSSSKKDEQKQSDLKHLSSGFSKKGHKKK